MFLLASACAGDAATAPADAGNTGSKAPATPVWLEVLPNKTNILRGMTLAPYVIERMSDSTTRFPVAAERWSSSNPQVLDVDAGTGSTIARDTGDAVIRVEFDGLVATAAMSVQNAADIGPSDELIIDSFSVLEIQGDDGWIYAPQARVRAAPVAGGPVYVLSLQLFLPGLGGSEPFNCSAKLTDALVDLNGSAYGDWKYQMEFARQVTGNQAAAIMVFADAAGTTTTRVVRGPVVSGSQPAYGGDVGGCFGR
jgi:hypothetical protein